MKTIKGALGIDPGRTKRQPMQAQGGAQMLGGAAGGPPAKGSGQLGQYHRQQQLAQQAQRPQPQTGGPMYAPQGAGAAPQTGGGYMMPQQNVGIGNYMQNQVGSMGQAPQMANPYAQQMAQMNQQMYSNAAGRMPQNVGDMTAQQRNPNYIQGR